jgi:hypothetical protein
MNKAITYLGQTILSVQTFVLMMDVLSELATVGPLNSAGFLIACVCIAVGNIDRNSIFYPSLLGGIMWSIILGGSI